jgi:hypothetical protein
MPSLAQDTSIDFAIISRDDGSERRQKSGLALQQRPHDVQLCRLPAQALDQEDII